MNAIVKAAFSFVGMLCGVREIISREMAREGQRQMETDSVHPLFHFPSLVWWPFDQITFLIYKCIPLYV